MWTHSETVKEVVSRLLVLHEQLEVFEDLFLYGHLVVVADGVLPKKVKLHHVLFTIHLLMKSYMYTSICVEGIIHVVCFFQSYAIYALIFTLLCCTSCLRTCDGQKQGITQDCEV